MRKPKKPVKKIHRKVLIPDLLGNITDFSTVKELINYLQTLPKDSMIRINRDYEYAEIEIFIENKKYSIEEYDKELKQYEVDLEKYKKHRKNKLVEELKKLDKLDEKK